MVASKRPYPGREIFDIVHQITSFLSVLEWEPRAVLVDRRPGRRPSQAEEIWLARSHNTHGRAYPLGDAYETCSSSECSPWADRTVEASECSGVGHC